jgi:hypothetical protein
VGSASGKGLEDNIGAAKMSASYESVLHAAKLNVERGSKKVFLTFLGGGVFGNKDGWIIDALLDAINSVEDADLDIYIVHYRTVEFIKVAAIKKGINRK